MVSYGGFISDNDEEGQIEEDGAKKSGVEARGQVFPITGHKTFTPRTQKELRGGRAKWLLTDLPDNAGNTFSNELMPLIRRKAGTLAPWTNLSTNELQELVDEVFGTGTYTVEAGDAWSGLASYHLHDCKEKTIRKAVKWYTKWTGKGNKKTAPYQWQTWEDNGHYKKGFAQSDAVIETFAVAHLDNINALPAPTDPLEDLPVRALIHALQAVEHSLNEYRTGTRIIDKTPRGFYSADNYGDKELEKKDENG
ncbi:hypothetical protein H0H92_012585, partial [Tricholoma furcatifolium]